MPALPAMAPWYSSFSFRVSFFFVGFWRIRCSVHETAMPCCSASVACLLLTVRKPAALPRLPVLGQVVPYVGNQLGSTVRKINWHHTHTAAFTLVMMGFSQRLHLASSFPLVKYMPLSASFDHRRVPFSSVFSTVSSLKSHSCARQTAFAQSSSPHPPPGGEQANGEETGGLVETTTQHRAASFVATERHPALWFSRQDTP